MSVGGGLVGSVGALILQRRRRARKAKQADNTISLIIMDRKSDGDQGTISFCTPESAFDMTPVIVFGTTAPWTSATCGQGPVSAIRIC